MRDRDIANALSLQHGGRADWGFPQKTTRFKLNPMV